MPVVESWIDTNWTKIVASTTTSGGTLKGLDNTALINAVWPLIEKDIDALDVDALIQKQIKEKLADENINEAWIVNKANNHEMLSMAKLVLSNYPTATITPSNITLDLKTVGDINAILAEKTITVKAGAIKAEVDVATLKGEIVKMAADELDTALNSSTTLKDMLAKNPDLKDYLIYSALVELGLTFNAEKTAAAKDGAVLANLVSTIKTEGKAKLAEKLDAKLGAINVSDILNNGSAEQTKYQEKISLLNSLKFDAANGIQTKTANELAAALTSQTMKDIVGSKGDTYVAQYLGKIVAKAQNLLPDSASITLNGVTLTENDLTALGNAKTSLEAVTELANLIAKFGDLSINSFADPAGQKVTVNYNTRSASANLIINVK